VKTGLTSVKPDGISALYSPALSPSGRGQGEGNLDVMVTPRGSKGANLRAAL